jgi:hypothetical protein
MLVIQLVIECVRPATAFALTPRLPPWAGRFISESYKLALTGFPVDADLVARLIMDRVTWELVEQA